MRVSIYKVALIASFFASGGATFATDVGGLICSDTTWDAGGSPYHVTGGSGIVIGCDATLTIEAGVEVKFDSELAIVVGSASFGRGSLVARGTAESPIVFTSVKDANNALDPAQPGDWSRIHFTDYAADTIFDPDTGDYLSGCILEHAIVEYAGHGDYGAIFAERSSPFLNRCEVRHNSYYGIKVDGTDAPPMNITNCEVWDHPQRGIHVYKGTAHRLADNNIHDNRDGGIHFSYSSTNTLTGNTISGNTTSSNGGGIYFDHTNTNTMTGNSISGNTTSSNGGGIYFYYSGSNTLSGNTITGNTASSNAGGICFYYSSGSNTLSGNSISSNIANNYGGGIWFYWNSTNTLRGNDIDGNRGVNDAGAIYFSDSDNNTLSRNTITNNQTDTGNTGGIYVTGGSEWLSLGGDPCEATYNIIRGNDGCQVRNDNAFNADGRNDVRAGYVQWGACDAEDIMDGICDYFDDASKAFVVFYPFVRPGDFDLDGELDFRDLTVLIDNWLRADCGIPDWCGGTDLDLSTTVDFFDYADSAKCWPGG